MISISSVMTPGRRLAVVGPDATVWEARRIMASRNIRHLPVVEGRRLVGLVSQTDLLVAENGRAVRIGEIMVRNVTTVDARANVRHAAVIMHERKLSCLPVMREERLVGIVTDSDFLGVAITLMEQLEEVEPEPVD